MSAEAHWCASVLSATSAAATGEAVAGLVETEEARCPPNPQDGGARAEASCGRLKDTCQRSSRQGGAGAGEDDEVLLMLQACIISVSAHPQLTASAGPRGATGGDGGDYLDSTDGRVPDPVGGRAGGAAYSNTAAYPDPLDGGVGCPDSGGVVITDSPGGPDADSGGAGWRDTAAAGVGHSPARAAGREYPETRD